MWKRTVLEDLDLDLVDDDGGRCEIQRGMLVRRLPLIKISQASRGPQCLGPEKEDMSLLLVGLVGQSRRSHRPLKGSLLNHIPVCQ